MTPDIQLLINCCKIKPIASDIEQIRLHLSRFETQQLSKIVTLAHNHGVYPLFYQALQTHAFDLLTSKNLTELKQHNMTVVMHNMRMTAELIRIIKLLEKNGIEALAFKGPTLAQIAYEDIMLRQYGDLDILIDESDAYMTGKLMCENGHIPSMPLEFLQNHTYLKVAKDFSMVSESGGVLTELHWRLFEKKFNILIPENIKGELQSVSINNYSIKTFPTNLLLVYLCLHGSKHGWERIIWICDIDRLLRSSRIDWRKAIDIAEASHSNRSFYLGLDLCNSFLQTPLPDSVIKRMGKYDVTELKALTLKNLNEKDATRNEFQNNKKTFFYQTKLYDSKIVKIYFCLKTFFGISASDCRTLLLPEKLKFLYVFLRP
ncbi:MAG: nucleotidyltransferase family protein, partial [Proteobacteria bacterium]|nr:nucleotidyltransferase family protein [Pseudomonadota bacterium]